MKNDKETISELSALMTGVMSIYKVACRTGGRKMTNQEAIDYLHLLESNVLLGRKITEAVHMAISALQELNDPNTNAGDTISRQAAIDAFGDAHPLDYNVQAYLSKIKALPSAQPEPCEDAINRKSVLEKISMKNNWEKDDRYNLGLSDAMKVVRYEPSVTAKTIKRGAENDENDRSHI